MKYSGGTDVHDMDVDLDDISTFQKVFVDHCKTMIEIVHYSVWYDTICIHCGRGVKHKDPNLYPTCLKNCGEVVSYCRV